MAMSSSEAKNQELSSPKKRAQVQPNAFVSLQITNSQVREKLKNNQKLMIENDKSISKLQVKPETFHFTLMVMKLELKSETLRTRLESTSADSHGFLESHFDLSKKALEESSKEVSKILSKLNFQFNLDKVSNFGKEVVFVTMGNEAEVIAFKEAAERVRNIFQDHGLPSTDSRSASPHVTLFKPSRGNYHIKLQPEVYQHLSAEATNCGTETFHSLQLCSMTHPKQENGYYHVIHEELLSHASV